MTRWCALFALTAFAAGCGSAHTGASTPPELLTLSEGRAIEIIGEVLSETSVPQGDPWPVQIATDTSMDVDVRLGTSRFGIEWLSEQDRVDFGSVLPPAASGGQLRIAPGVEDDENVEVLILDHAEYRYANERQAVQSGVPGAHETEARLRRDVRDYLAYVRGEGGV